MASRPPSRNTCTTHSQCLNGGQCVLTLVGLDSFMQCHCQVGYQGTRCEEKICPCQHGGVCRSTIHHNTETTLNENEDEILRQTPEAIARDGHECKCLGYFTGNYCETPYVNCRSDGVQCFNGGLCLEDGEASSCKCPYNFKGNYCHVFIPNAKKPDEKTAAAPIKPGAVSEVMDEALEYWHFFAAGGLFLTFIVFAVCCCRLRSTATNRMVHKRVDDADGIFNDATDPSFYRDEADDCYLDDEDDYHEYGETVDGDFHGNDEIVQNTLSAVNGGQKVWLNPV